MNFLPFNTGSGISFVRILGSISKTLGLVRQVSPIVTDLKPLISKIPSLFDRINSLRAVGINAKNEFSALKNVNYNQEIFNQFNGNGPNFFQ